MKTCFLVTSVCGYPAYTKFPSIKEAKEDFHRSATELDRYGQKHVCSLHIANTQAEVAEYPDKILSLGPRGGLRVEST